MADKTIYERGHPTRDAVDGTFCFGYVSSIDVANRLATVKTFFASDPALNDQSIKGCQWLSADASPDGDEMGSMPRRGSVAFVFFVLGEAFIMGFFRGAGAKGGAASASVPVSLTEGDKIIATRAGNFVTVKANGLVQVQCKDTLRSLYLPNGSQWLNLCRAFELKTDGGAVSWKADKELNTLHSATYRKDMAQTFIVTEQKGNVSTDTIYRIGIGPGAGGGAVTSYEHTVGVDGTSTLKIATLGVGGYESVVTPQGSATIKTAGDASLTSTLGNVTAEATIGSVQLAGSEAKLKLSAGQVGLGGPTGEVVALAIESVQLSLDTLNAVLQLTVIGNLGYTSSPPVNSPDFLQLVAQATALKAKLTSISGGI